MKHGLELAWRTVANMIDGFFSLLPNLLIATIVFLIFHLVSRVIQKLAFDAATRASVDRTLAHAISKLIGVAAVVFGLLVAAVIVVPTFSPDKLIAGLGITSVAIGFAFQNILQNFFAGMLLLWQKPFRIGDEIKARDYEGTVEDIQIRTTLLRTHTGQRVYIPNGVLFTDPVTVNTAYGQRQIHLQIPFTGLPSKDAVDIAGRALSRLDSIAKDPAPKIYLSVTGQAMSLDIYIWADSRNQQLIAATDEATVAVQEALLEASKRKVA